MNFQVASNYSIVEDLALAPCMKSTLDVLKTYPTHRKALLMDIGVVDLTYSQFLMFHTIKTTPRLDYQIAF